jgi:hypothetical protein
VANRHTSVPGLATSLGPPRVPRSACKYPSTTSTQKQSFTRVMQARDAVDPFFSLTFWTDADRARTEISQYIARFAFKSREMLRYEIAGSTLATSSTRSSIISSPSDLNIPGQTRVMSSAASTTSTIRGGSASESPSPPPSYPATPSIVSTASGSSRSSRRRFFGRIFG